jgi:hypothetical protein
MAERAPGLLRRRPPPPAPDPAPGADPLPGPDDFVIYRILGNDLEPRHARGQTRENLAFILVNEPPLEGCAKRWIVNRIVDPREEARLMALLAEHGQETATQRIPFEPEAYARIGWDLGRLPPDFLASPACAALEPEAQERLWLATYRLKALYAMHNNGARNAALAEGRGLAKWVLPWDGACFVTVEAWAAIRAAVAAAPGLRYFAVPMARVADNAALRAPGFAPPAEEEPQIILRRDAPEAFDEAFPYGRRPKVELFWRLGLPGPWDAWRDDPWDPPRRPPAPEAVGRAGWVARLASGREALERADKASFLDRGAARRKAIAGTLDRIDDGLAAAGADPAGLLCYSSAALARLSAGAAPGLAAALVAEAEAALGRGPFSVMQKTTLPPGGNRRDYWHPAPYWHPNRWIPGGLPYVQRDGVRVAGTRLYEPESDKYDRTRLQRVFDDVTSLTLAWSVTGREDFAAHAARQLAAWFVDHATAMTPHLTYAQVRRGRNRNRGTGAGIIEFKDLHHMLDAARLLEAGGALDAAAAAGLRGWLGAYLGWLGTSPQGARERGAKNNHGVYYDLQAAAIAAHLGDRERLRRALLRAEGRIPVQITPEGSMPAEMARRTTAHYALFTLQGWVALARVGRRRGLLRPDPAAAPWDRVSRALAWVFAQDLAAWPHPQIGPFDPARGLPLAAHALETGLVAPEALPPAFRGPFAAARPVFDPHDGPPPWWALTAPGLIDPGPGVRPGVGLDQPGPPCRAAALAQSDPA